MTPATGHQAAPGWYADPAAPGAVRLWDGHGWTEQAAPTRSHQPRRLSNATIAIAAVITLAVAAFALVGIGLATRDSDSGSGPSNTTSRESPASAMFDPTATQDEVIADINAEYCGKAVSDVPFPNGSRYVTCLRDERFVAFYVWPDVETFEIARVAGIDCEMDVVVWGPTWTAQMMSATDAQPLLDGGASQGTCDRS